VFAGLRKVLEQNRNAVIVFEFSLRYIKNFGLDPREFLSSLSAQGYELSVIDDEHHRIEAAGVDTILHLGERSYRVLNLLARRRETQRLASHSLRGLD
jgi:hypothetical protein